MRFSTYLLCILIASPAAFSAVAAPMVPLRALVGPYVFSYTPAVFNGSYKLVESREGMCFEATEIEVSGTDLDFGSGFRFFNIGAGEQNVDDDLVMATWHAEMTGVSTLQQSSVLITKASGTVSATRSKATLEGTRLRLQSHTTQQDAGGIFSVGTDCLFKKVK